MRVSRLTVACVAALLALSAVLPASAACCMSRAPKPMTAMHVAMPCCGDRCEIQRPAGSTSTDAVLAERVPPVMLAVALDLPVALPARPLAAPQQQVTLVSSGPPSLLALRI